MDAVGFLQRKRPFPLRETSFSFKGNFGFLEEKRAFPLGETVVPVRRNARFLQGETAIDCCLELYSLNRYPLNVPFKSAPK
jgi:hypothetical protein